MRKFFAMLLVTLMVFALIPMAAFASENPGETEDPVKTETPVETEEPANPTDEPADHTDEPSETEEPVETEVPTTIEDPEPPATGGIALVGLGITVMAAGAGALILRKKH